MFLILFITYFLPVVSELEKLYSARVRDNKLVAIYQSWNSFNTKVRVFELKEGPIADVYNSRKTFNFGRIDEDFALVELDTPEDLKENKNKLWVRYKFQGISYPASSPFMNGVGYIDLNDVSLKNDSSFKFPTHENFPVKDYTINTITNELGSAIYIAGGEIYSKKDKEFLTSNSFYKYNFTTKEWIDMTYSTNGYLKPLSGHKSVVVDNRYLVILGGKRQINYSSKPSFYDHNQPFYEYSSLYNLTVFDTITDSWEKLNIKANLFDTSIALLNFQEFLATVFNDKVIILGGLFSENKSNTFISNGYLGVLDFKSKAWSWILMIDEENRISKIPLNTQDLIVFNDQLIICTDVSERDSYMPIRIYDIYSHKMKSVFKSSNPDYNNNGTRGLTTYVIVLISFSCIVLLVVFVYLLYSKLKKYLASKNVKVKSNGPIREVWADPDINSIKDIISFNQTNYFNTIEFNQQY